MVDGTYGIIYRDRETEKEGERDRDRETEKEGVVAQEVQGGSRSF